MLPPDLQAAYYTDRELGAFIDALEPLCQPLSRKYARTHRDDLDSHLRMPEILLQFVVLGGQSRVVEFDPEEHPEAHPRWSQPRPRVEIPVDDTLGHLPRYELSMAKVVETIFGRCVYEVEIGGTFYICKIAGS
ncbi:hypothetical protein BDV10DRAFT_190071 [Aspergillus recurvatus]